MKPFSLIQLYFVLASLTGLILMIIGSVSIIKIGADKLIGVQPYPEFTAPYPPTVSESSKDAIKETATESQKADLAEWEQNYTQWQEAQKNYNQEEQRIKRDLAQALSMIAVGIPVFWIHAPRIFKGKE
jgi:Lon protease-like protein